jgi:hypothetical protein
VSDAEQSASPRLAPPSKTLANRTFIGGSTMRWFPEEADEDRERPPWSWLVGVDKQVTP